MFQILVFQKVVTRPYLKVNGSCKENIILDINSKFSHVLNQIILSVLTVLTRGGSRTARTSKMEHSVIIVNGWKALTTITKSFILDVAAVLDSPLLTVPFLHHFNIRCVRISQKSGLWRAVKMTIFILPLFYILIKKHYHFYFIFLHFRYCLLSLENNLVTLL